MNINCLSSQDMSHESESKNMNENVYGACL